MITGVDLNKTIDFILKKDKKNPTIWKISAIPSSIAGQIAMGHDWTKTVIAVRAGLKGWENFCVEGQPVEFEETEDFVYGKTRMMLTSELAEKIPPHAVIEIASEIFKISGLTKDASKN